MELKPIPTNLEDETEHTYSEQTSVHLNGRPKLNKKWYEYRIELANRFIELLDQAEILFESKLEECGDCINHTLEQDMFELVFKVSSEGSGPSRNFSLQFNHEMPDETVLIVATEYSGDN